MAKGGQFERDFSRDLSLWWTEGRRDDVFWRSSQSGGRATSRSKQGKTTFGQSGDISAIDPIGRDFLDLFTVELKKGYKKNGNAFDSVDKVPKRDRVTLSFWEKFILQVQRDAEEAGTRFWLLVHHKTSRVPVAFFPYRLQKECPSLRGAHPSVILMIESVKELIMGLPWSEFKRRVSPRQVLNMRAKLIFPPHSTTVIRVKRITRG